MCDPESVYQMPGDTSRFYAAFTTGASDGLVGSAICTYSMEDIQEAFAGRFKEQVCCLNCRCVFWETYEYHLKARNFEF